MKASITAAVTAMRTLSHTGMAVVSEDQKKHLEEQYLETMCALISQVLQSVT